MDRSPRINDPVVLRDSADRSYASRVEGAGPGVLTVAQPLDLRAAGAFADGDVVITWTCDRGVRALPARLIRRHTEGRVRLWDLAVVGEPWVEQRRDYVRVEVSGPVVLRRRDDAAGSDLVEGELADVSEAALRCAVDGEWFGRVLADRAELDASFRLDGIGFTAPCRVHRHGRDPRSGKRVDAVLLLDLPAREADVLRGLIFARQLRDRPVRRAGDADTWTS